MSLPKKTKRTNNTLKEISDALPNLKSEKVVDISIELEKILAIKALFQSPGGEILIEKLRHNCALALRKALITARKGENANPFILDFGANVDLLAVMQDISLEEELRQQLDDAVIEASM